jgi:hypothetical protein
VKKERKKGRGARKDEKIIAKKMKKRSKRA